MADGLDTIEALPDIDLIDGASLEDIQGLLINLYTKRYGELTGTSINLSKADPNRLILLACAQVIYQGLQLIDKGGKMNFLKYAYDDYLDNLAALKKVTRLQSRCASAPIRFSLSAVRETATAIPAGTVVSAGSEAFFATEGYAEIPAGETEVIVMAQCTEAGEAGNGYLPGEISSMASPIGFIAEASNVGTSTGGMDEEDDEAFAERIYLAPSSYSTAGPDDAYEYWVRTSGVDVDDVLVTSPEPGKVSILFTVNGGQIPDNAALETVRQYVSQRGRRPLTDLVEVKAPETVGFQLDADYYISSRDSGSVAMIQREAMEALKDYLEWQTAKIGRDINPDELIYRLKGAGVKRVVVRQPQYQVVKETAKPSLGNGDLLYRGIEDD